MSDNQRLIKKLEQAQAVISEALLLLRDEVERFVIKEKCPICGEPIFSTDRIQRGVHTKCVSIANARVKSGELTQEFIDSVLEPPQSGGRKKKQLPLDLAAMKPGSKAAEKDIATAIQRTVSKKDRRKAGD